MVEDMGCAGREGKNNERNKRICGMVKYAAARSGSKYVVGREGWKSMVVNRLIVWMWSTSVVSA